MCAAVREGMLHAFYGCRITVFTLRDFEANFFQRGHCFGSAPRPTAETTEQPVRGLGVGGWGFARTLAADCRFCRAGCVVCSDYLTSH